MLKTHTPYPGILAFEFKTQYEVCATFMRLQEFYESPFEDINGKVFSVEHYMDRYAKEYGNFTYTSDWNGFNIPGHIVKKFILAFGDNEPFTNKEKLLLEAMNIPIGDFYVIGYWGEKPMPTINDSSSLFTTLAHEIAHGLFYLNSSYKAKMQELLGELPADVAEQMRSRLLELGYNEQVVPDEMQAFLATSEAKYLRKRIGKGLTQYAKPFKSVFRKTIQDSESTIYCPPR